MCTSSTIAGYRRAARQRIFETPPRSPTAFSSPPPGVERSCRNRNASSRLDFPAAFGPATKTRCCRGTSTCAKLRQFSRANRVTCTGLYAGGRLTRLHGTRARQRTAGSSDRRRRERFGSSDPAALRTGTSSRFLASAIGPLPTLKPLHRGERRRSSSFERHLSSPHRNAPNRRSWSSDKVGMVTGIPGHETRTALSANMPVTSVPNAISAGRGGGRLMRAESGPVSRTEVGTAEGRELRATGRCPRGRDAVARRTRLRFRPGCGRSACRRRRALAAPCPAARRPRVDRAVHHVVIFRRNLTAWCRIHTRTAMIRGGAGRRARGALRMWLCPQWVVPRSDQPSRTTPSSNRRSMRAGS